MSIDDFLRQRLDEDEQVARAAIGETAHFTYADSAGPVRTHITRWSSARVLAEVSAKRRIVDLHSGAHECSTFDRNGEVDNCTWCLDSDECSTMALLAMVYAEHPDYSATWQPDSVAEHR